jgi:hypothetical protein
LTSAVLGATLSTRVSGAVFLCTDSTQRAICSGESSAAITTQAPPRLFGWLLWGNSFTRIVSRPANQAA